VKNLKLNEITNEIMNEMYYAVQDIQKERWSDFGHRFGKITFDLMNKQEGTDALQN